MMVTWIVWPSAKVFPGTDVLPEFVSSNLIEKLAPDGTEREVDVPAIVLPPEVEFHSGLLLAVLPPLSGYGTPFT